MKKMQKMKKKKKKGGKIMKNGRKGQILLGTLTPMGQVSSRPAATYVSRHL